MKIVGIAGPAGVGKDTFAELLLSAYKGSRVAFADPLRAALTALLSVPMSTFIDRDKKEAPLPGFPDHVTPRFLAQTLGTEWARDIVCNDFWTRLIEWKIKTLEEAGEALVVITDVRFDNEARWILSKGGIVLQLQREYIREARRHASEIPVSKDLVTEVVTTDSAWSIRSVSSLITYLES